MLFFLLWGIGCGYKKATKWNINTLSPDNTYSAYWSTLWALSAPLFLDISNSWRPTARSLHAAINSSFKVSMYLFYLQMTGVLSLETLQSLVWVQFQSYLIFSLWFSTTAYIHQKEMIVMKLLLEVIRCQGRQMTNHWSPYIAVLHNTAIKLQDTGH